MPKYEAWYLDDIGNRIGYIPDIISLEYVHVLGDIGFGVIHFPVRNQLYNNTTIDRRIALYRLPYGGSLELEFIMNLRNFNFMQSNEGLRQQTSTGFDFNELLTRRIVAYFADSAQSKQTATSDNMMKEIVRDNFIDNADYSGTPSPSRDIDAYGFSVDSNLSQGVTLTKGFSWQNVMRTLQDIQADSKAQGTETFFAVIPTTETTMQFRTWVTPQDRTSTTGTKPIIFSSEYGNLQNPTMTFQGEKEVNYVYAGGQGIEDTRKIQTSSDTNRMSASRFNRREGFVFSNGKTDDEVLSDARNAIERFRPKTPQFNAQILATQQTPYGGDGWKVGTKVSIQEYGYNFDCLVRAVHVQLKPDGKEIIKGRVESV